MIESSCNFENVNKIKQKCVRKNNKIMIERSCNFENVNKTKQNVSAKTIK